MGRDPPLKITISVSKAPAIDAMLPFCIGTSELQTKFLKLLGDIVEEAHHESFCSNQQRHEFKHALDCARATAAKSALNALWHPDAAGSSRRSKEPRRHTAQPELRRPPDRPDRPDRLEPKDPWEVPARPVAFTILPIKEEEALTLGTERDHEEGTGAEGAHGMDLCDKDGVFVDEGFMSSELCQQESSGAEGAGIDSMDFTDFEIDDSTKSTLHAVRVLRSGAHKGKMSSSSRSPARQNLRSESSDSRDLGPSPDMQRLARILPAPAAAPEVAAQVRQGQLPYCSGSQPRQDHRQPEGLMATFKRVVRDVVCSPRAALPTSQPPQVFPVATVPQPPGGPPPACVFRTGEMHAKGKYKQLGHQAAAASGSTGAEGRQPCDERALQLA